MTVGLRSTVEPQSIAWPKANRNIDKAVMDIQKNPDFQAWRLTCVNKK